MENAKQNVKVLIVEDDVMLNKIYQTKLGIVGYKVFAAYDGEEGIKKMEETLPNIVLLDLMLPKVNGLQILAEMRKNPNTRKTPVIVLSNLGQADDATKALQLGADDYVVKLNTPPSSVLKKIQMLLSQRKARDAIYLSRYHIKIDTTQEGAQQLVRDFTLIFYCVHCRTQQILELMPDYNSTGSGHRFVAQFVCPICKSVY